MKKVIKLLAVIITVTVTLTGCGAKKNEVQTHKIDNGDIKIQESNSNSNIESNSNIVIDESNITSNTSEKVYSDGEVISKAINYLNVSNGTNINFKGTVESKNGNNVSIRIYEDMKDNTATSGLYTIDNRTLKGKNDLTGESIDLNNPVKTKTSNKTSNTTSNKTSNKQETNYYLEGTETYVDNDGNTILYRVYMDRKGKTYSAITALNKSNKEIWKYTTKVTEETQFPEYDFVGGGENIIYLKDGQNLLMINTKNGKVVHEFKNFSSGPANYRGMYSTQKYDFIPIYSGIADMSVIKVIDRESRKIIKVVYRPSTEEYSYVGMGTNGVVTCKDSDGKDIEFDVEKILKSDFDFSKIK